MNLTCILVVPNKCQQEQIIELFWKVVWCNVSIRIACKWLQFSYLSKLKLPSEQVREKKESNFIGQLCISVVSHLYFVDI